MPRPWSILQSEQVFLGMTDIQVDADACPVKGEVVRVADRHGLKVHMVSNGGIRPDRNPLVELVIVAQQADAADDWIADHIQNPERRYLRHQRHTPGCALPETRGGAALAVGGADPA